MTLPDERYRAVMAARELLIDLTDPKATPRINKLLRLRAGHCLRHYPNTWEMDRASQGAPDVFQKQMEDLHRFLLKGKEVKDENRT